ncbi:hypothetical protein F66182_2378 [Fusarium sp. NRRL 66182]|nr:hypothetical protein F66182_2378 [Fusarium sp. NRRL 66182]
MANLSSTIVTKPWNISALSNNNADQLQTLFAPAWVGSPDVRGTMDILQSCILTLVACIYTALHLDVPRKTTWQHLLWVKTKWVIVTLLAPEISVYMAAVQLRQALNLRSALRKIQKEKQSSNWTSDADFEIDLKYAFFIVMGAVRFDVHDILSIPDLDDSAHKLFRNSGGCQRSIRLGPAFIIWLAERGHWIEIRKSDIDDKSKADTVQKTLVVIQVLWMVVQCIARGVSDLPLSLLEIHTMVHVVCAVLLYACWFEKPLDIQEAIIYNPDKFKGELAIMLQKQYYCNLSYKIALFPPKLQDDEDPPTHVDGQPMRWIAPEAEVNMKIGELLPSGLALYAANIKKSTRGFTEIYLVDLDVDTSEFSLKLTAKSLERWDAILTTFPFEGRDKLAREAKKLEIEISKQSSPKKENESNLAEAYKGVLFLARLEELEPKTFTDWERPFWEGKSIFHIDLESPSDTTGSNNWKHSIAHSDVTVLSFRLLFLATLLPGLYGGVHLAAWGWGFPSYTEEIMWKLSCLIIVCDLPISVLVLISCFFWMLFFAESEAFKMIVPERWRERWSNSWGVVGYFVLLAWVQSLLALGYIFARVFIIVESFISLRRAPVGVFISPEWIELFPHF